MNIAITSAPNFEEAASVAFEFIASLDNLPSEVQHLLQEMKIKEQRCQELQQDIAKDQSRYIKASLKQTQSIPTPTEAFNDQKSESPAATPNGINPKAHLPGRIAAAYNEIDSLTDEKIALARRIVDLITRTRARLDADLSRVRVLQGEPPEDSRNMAINLAQPLPLTSPYGIKRFDGLTAGTPVVQIGESLRNATGGNQPDTISISASSGPAYKKRRLTTNTAIKLPSPAPATQTALHHSTSAQSRSRLSRQSHVARHQQEEEDLDADGDEDVEGEDAEEDLTEYCFCQKQSYGDMIGCDNPDCPYQWFHITCVGVKTPLPDKWYCPECIKTKSIASEKRKGRKK
ncbi:hypothetical protein B0H34DRAFT_690096 [Crassisporium funariophilum]|nr:hypothetical protein B0H34DRAFT_690096 [Crassisporium funariophilum]